MMVKDVYQLGEKRAFDHLAVATATMDRIFRAEEEEINMISPRPTTNSFLGKRKNCECHSRYSRENPNNASSSSPSFWPLDDQYSRQNPNHASSSSPSFSPLEYQYSRRNPNHASSSSSSWPVESQYSQLNPNHASSSSSSSWPVESKKLHVNSNKPMRRESVSESESVREPIIRELVIRNPVSRELVIREPIRQEPARREAFRREAVREREPVRERRTPEWLVNLMSGEKGVDAKLIIEKDLTKSDLNTNQGRLLIPFKAIEDKDFLNEEELNIIDEHFNKIRDRGVDVVLVDSRGIQWEINLRRWDMNSSSNYVFVSGWNHVTVHNGLKAGHMIRLWSFRSQERLYFALVPQQAHAPAEALALPAPPVPAPAEPLALPPPSPPPSPLVLDEASHLKFDKERDRILFVDVPRKKRFRCARVTQARASANLNDQEERDRESTYFNIPKTMRTTRVEVPAPAPVVTRDSGDLISNITGLHSLAAVACADGSPRGSNEEDPSVTRDPLDGLYLLAALAGGDGSPGGCNEEDSSLIPHVTRDSD